MTIKICFNLYPYISPDSAGAEVYLRNIAELLSRRQKIYHVCAVIKKGTAYVWGPYLQNVEILELAVPIIPSRIARIIFEQLFLPLLFKKHNIDVVISNYVIPLLFSDRQIVVIHDMLYKDYPSLLEGVKSIYWRIFIPLSIWRARQVVTVSQFSKERLCQHFPRYEKKVSVANGALNRNLKQQKETNDYKIGNRSKDPYVLCVAAIKRHKNLINLMKAWEVVLQNIDDIKLILVGSPSSKDDRKYFEEVKRFMPKNSVEIHKRLSAPDLTKLYRGASLYVFPSMYEGFGLPVLEAQAFGIPVVCSNAASLPEIGGKGALYFHPQDFQEIAEAIIKVLKDENLREDLVEKGENNYPRFSWEKAVDKIELIIMSMVD